MNTNEILKHDTLASTEKAVGKHWSEFNHKESGMAMLDAMRDSELRASHLKEINDTYFTMTWKWFKDRLIEGGFSVGLSYDLPYEDAIEEAIIYYHKEKGLILWSQSFNDRTSVNGGTCYGEIKARSKDKMENIFQWMSTGGRQTDYIWKTSFDIREGMFHRIKQMEKDGDFLPRWTNSNRFLWFVDWNEQKIKDYDYKKISLEKLKCCSEEVQSILL